jgi:hypothetical protein
MGTALILRLYRYQSKQKGEVTMDLRKHVTVLGALRIGFGALGLLAAAIVFVAVVGGGLLSGDQEAITITAIVGTVIAGVVALVSLPWIIAGVGLLKFKPWARLLSLILSVFDLVNVPFGTALAAYTYWALIQDEAEKLFAPTASQ